MSSSNENNQINQPSTRNCRKFKFFYPNYTHVITGLSTTTSKLGDYSLVYITGSNFLPNGTTFIQFGTFGYIPAIFYNSFSLSFVVPLNLSNYGIYNIKVVNLYNANFNLRGNHAYSSNLNISADYIPYNITNIT